MGARPGGGAHAAAMPPGWVPLSHAESIRSTEGLELVAVCDVDEKSAAVAAERWGVESIYTDYRQLLKEVTPDILSVATRTPGRADIVKAAADGGVRALHVEKPFANTLAECDAALEAVRRAGAALTYGTTRRFMAAYRQAKRMIEEGEIGGLEQITVDHGRTTIMWNHAHSVDLLLFLAGSTDIDFVQGHCQLPPESVQGLRVDADPVLEMGHVRFTSGINGVVTSAGGLHTRISGTKGTLTVFADGRTIEIRKNVGVERAYHLDQITLLPNVERSGTVQAFTELRDALLTGARPSITPAEVRAGLNVLFGFVRSTMERGRRLGLPEVEPEFTVTGRSGQLVA
jgi:predicted dehydrogenase